MFKHKSGRKSEYTVDEEAQRFFMNGYFTRSFTPDTSLNHLLRVVKEVNTNPKTGFAWEKKYERSEDLSPPVYAYDDIFVNFLFTQNIPQFLRDVTGFDLALGDIALRRHEPGQSYMAWHRDTHFYSGQKSAGRMPPIYKIIVYFALGEQPSPQLQVVPGSHLRFFQNQYLDYAQAFMAKKVTISSSDSAYFFFNSMLFHNVPNNRTDKPSLRLFYNFCQPSQLKHFPGREDLHQTYLQKKSAFAKKEYIQ